jgi:hypothetical protein
MRSGFQAERLGLSKPGSWNSEITLHFSFISALATPANSPVVSKSRCPVFIASEVSGLMDIRVMVSQAPERSEDWA